MLRSHLDALDLLDGVPPGAPLQGVAQSVAECLGYEWFIYDDTLGRGPISNGPVAWGDHYRRSAYEASDPIRRLAERTGDLVMWSAAESPLPRTAGTEAFLRDSVAHGPSCGVHIPLAVGFGRRAFLAFSGRGRVAHRLDGRLTGLLITVGSRLSLLAQGRAAEDPGAGVRLSQQELLCLTWCAEGKSMTETATILGLSRRTVEFHLTNARAKLGAATVAQAVARAVRSGTIA